MKKIKAVIFDMDGLMIDSEPLHVQAFNSVLEKYDKHLTEEENKRRYIGLSDEDQSQDIILRFGLPISTEELVLRKQAVFMKILKNQLIPQQGLMKLLKKLDQTGYKTAIASSSPKDVIRAVIEGLKIADFIDDYVSAEEVENGKPAPDIYLSAAKRLKVQPSECLVLEDAPRGVQAAKAAGMICFAIPSGFTQNEDFSQSDKVLNNLSEVFSLLT